MNILLKILPQKLPGFIRKEILTELFESTADAFECPTPALGHLTYDARLRTYAQFTSEQAEKVLKSGRDIPAIKTRLYQNAYALGEKLRKWFNVNSMEEVIKLGQTLYRAIGIEIEGDALGEITVNRCLFCHYYSIKVCDLISALDDGVFSGLSGGGRLAFSQRITEGRECCRARLRVDMEGG
jgi:hypothetical protein